MARSKIEVEVDIVNKAKGLTTCKVCGRDFPLIKEEHYVVRDGEKKGVIAAFSVQEEGAWYDAFDCPHCGCQNIMQGRKRELCECEEEEEEVPETEDHDGCEGCTFEDIPVGDYPCNECKQSHLDLFKGQEDSDE